MHITVIYTYILYIYSYLYYFSLFYFMSLFYFYHFFSKGSIPDKFLFKIKSGEGITSLPPPTEVM